MSIYDKIMESKILSQVKLNFIINNVVSISRCVGKKMALLVFECLLVCRLKPNVPFEGRLSFYTDAQLTYKYHILVSTTRPFAVIVRLCRSLFFCAQDTQVPLKIVNQTPNLSSCALDDVGVDFSRTQAFVHKQFLNVPQSSTPLKQIDALRWLSHCSVALSLTAARFQFMR